MGLCYPPTFVPAGGEAAAGDPQVMGVLLGEDLVHVQVPQPQVSVGGAAGQGLPARAEGELHHCGIIHRPGAGMQTHNTHTSDIQLAHNHPKEAG